MNGGPVSGTDIFLSYARQDQSTARMFTECLRAEGFSIWWDASLHSGETFDEVIERNLREAKAVVVLWSPRSVSSRWVRAEATLADRRNKLVPAMIEDCDRPIIFELTHAADLADWTGDTSDVRWRTFVQDLRRLVDAGEEHGAPKVGSEHTKKRQPLRPGSHEVVVAEPAPRSETPPQPPQPVPVPDPVDSEVHCLEHEGVDFEGTIVVDSSGVKMGRTAPADVVLSHKSISREHCMIGLANDELIVTDLNSTNGTYIDGSRITRTTILPIGSVVRLGQVSLRHSVHPRGEAERRARSSNSNRQAGQQNGRLAATS
ncbi:MAG TPA: TIR domain-containing protein [Sphingomicrobium sp.]|jgi:hypothetical protein|nr:TIR domain-containing protein [Sphingomicrobium sp.]